MFSSSGEVKVPFFSPEVNKSRNPNQNIPTHPHGSQINCGWMCAGVKQILVYVLGEKTPHQFPVASAVSVNAVVIV